MLQSREKYFDKIAILPAALRSYIPKQLLKNVAFEKCLDAQNGLEYVQKVLNNSNDSLRMYGSAESLFACLNDYVEFPLSRNMFPLGTGNYYSTIPDIYQNLKKEVLYCKQDLLFYLQSCVYAELELHDDEQKVKFAELIEYMRKHEERLSGCYEFVKYDHDVFEDIRKPFFCSRSLYVFPKDAVVTAVRHGERLVTSYEEKDFVKVFDNLISKYPCFFLPNSETKDRNATAVVRIFDDRGFKFVMESELFAAINLKNPDQKPLECKDVEGHYRTIDYTHVLGRYRDQIGDIDFIHHPFSISLHVAVPIAAPTGDHCIRAVDAKEDIFFETILALGVFQKITRNTCHMIPKFVAILEKYFPSNIKYRYFMNLKLFKKLREELEEFWKPIEDIPMKRVRNVGPRGFTVEDLKKELKYLGYTEIFHEITAEARGLFTRLFHSLKPNQLETMHMYKAIQNAITRVMYKRYPCFDEFMYRQKICVHTPGKPCDHCSKAIKEAEARIEAEMKAESEQASSSVTAKTSGDDAEKEKDSEESNRKSVTNEAPEKTINNPVEAEINSLPAISEPAVPEHNPVLPDSNTHICENCMETSNEAREEVIEAYRKIMILEKKLKEKDAELERLRVYEDKSKKSDETEKKIKNLEIEAEECKMKHFKILEENVKMGNMLKSSGNSKALESQVKEKDEQLKVAQKALEEKEERCQELEKTVKEKEEKVCELSKVNMSVNQEKENIKATLFESLTQLAEKDEEIDKLKKENLEGYKELKSSISDLERRLNAGMKQQKENDSKIQKLELKSSKLTEEKNQEIEKLKKQQALAANEHKKEIEQMKRHASKSADEIKKLTAEKERAENLLKRTNKGHLEKLQKSESSLKEVTNRRIHLETEVAEKNRKILELEKSAKKQVSDQEKAKEELEAEVSTIRAILDRIAPRSDCVYCLEEIKRDQKTLKCEHCRNIVHLECAAKWLKDNRSCPNCRREQLDPTEFPSLR
ncbi:unnamed protein product [Caenorhabditis brenneri]